MGSLTIPKYQSSLIGIKENEVTTKTTARISRDRDDDDDDEVSSIDVLRKEIKNLEEKLSEKEETIDFLCEERDESCNIIYDLRLELAEAWNLKLASNAEKVREVARLMKNEKVVTETMIKNLEEECDRLNNEVSYLNDDVIESLVVERDELRDQLISEIKDKNVVNNAICDRNKIQRKQLVDCSAIIDRLEESTAILKQMEEELQCSNIEKGQEDKSEGSKTLRILPILTI